MKKFVALCVMGFVASACQFTSAADLKSGLQVDEYPHAFNVTDVTGPSAGKKLCYRCQYGERPVVSIFVRKMDANTAKLVKQLDEVVAKHEEKKMAAFVTVLSDDPDAQETTLKQTADDQKISHTPLTVFENAVGPTKYKIDEHAGVTVMMWVDNNVKVNHAFADGDLSDAAIAKVIEDTAKILN
jgi:hypothetical protein